MRTELKPGDKDLFSKRIAEKDKRRELVCNEHQSIASDYKRPRRFKFGFSGNNEMRNSSDQLKKLK